MSQLSPVKDFAVSMDDLDVLRSEIVGIDCQVPLLDGSWRTYTFLDNAASTPAFRSVLDKVNESMVWYSSVHRGSGYKSLVSTEVYEKARRIVAEFVGADLENDVVIFGKNTSEAVNILAYALPPAADGVILTTMMEHHSNDLPWRAQGNVIHVAVHEDGSVDLEDYRQKLELYRGKIRLVAISGASNVSGFVQPVHEMAEMAHRCGSLFMVDAAQLAPHRAIQMGKLGDPGRLDFVVLSGHKMYAPFGAGALIGPREFFRQMPPLYRGGGTIDLVSLDEVFWTEPPERFEAGSPNIIGPIALAASIRKLTQIGMDRLAAHEAELTTYLLERLEQMQGIKVYGSTDPSRTKDRLGVVTLEVEGMHHGKVAAILSFEGGIGVRNGCFCAHPYVVHLMKVEGETYRTFRNQVLQHDRSNLPGLVRVSFGCYNNTAEIDHLLWMLKRIVRGDYRGDYVLDKAHGSYYPRDFKFSDVEHLFTV